MNVYDFDKTIFYPDSSATFLLTLLKKNPRVFRYELDAILEGFLDYAQSGFTDANAVKEGCFRTLRYVSDLDYEIESFWNRNMFRIGEWYLERRKEILDS